VYTHETPNKTRKLVTIVTSAVTSRHKRRHQSSQAPSPVVTSVITSRHRTRKSQASRTLQTYQNTSRATVAAVARSEINSNDPQYKTETALRIQGLENSRPTYLYKHCIPYRRLQDGPEAHSTPTK